ncbi:MAG TPA: 1-deoxy-D-xylulose-5-phosphate synthase [Candidatus Angelobacter sp.]|nr:1-deoxy-D-xylulose-5-phosphate synthase [Candidatus Angelobacter sp.]
MKKTRIMYIESKGDGISGPGRIGRVRFSKTGKSIYYKGKMFQSLKGSGFKANYFDAESGEEYWISGCKKDGGDHLYGSTTEIDDDVREEYWREIRKMPGMAERSSVRAKGKY